MKKIYALSLFAGVFLTMQSCTKKVDLIESAFVKQLTIDTTIGIHETFNVDLSSVYSPTRKVKIIQQGKYFEFSVIQLVEDTNYPYYTYTSNTQTGVTDKVVLSVTDTNPAAATDSTIVYVNVKIK